MALMKKKETNRHLKIRAYMKKIIIAAIVCIIAVLSAGAVLSTSKAGYAIVRTAVETTDSAPSASQRTYAYWLANYTAKSFIPSNINAYESQEGRDNAVQFTFSFNDNAGTATVAIYGIKYGESAANKLYTPLEPICVYSLTAGTQETGDSTARYYADTAVESADYWGNVEAMDASGDNGVSKIMFDGRGYYAFVVLFTAISSGDNVSCYASYY